MQQGFYGGYMGNAGALSDLVYRGDQPQFTTLPNQGTTSEIQLLSQGIPAYQDPRFPMTKEQFEREVEERRFNKRYQAPGSFMRDVLKYNQINPLGPGAVIPAGFDGKYVS